MAHFGISAPQASALFAKYMGAASHNLIALHLQELTLEHEVQYGLSGVRQAQAMAMASPSTWTTAILFWDGTTSQASTPHDKYCKLLQHC